MLFQIRLVKRSKNKFKLDEETHVLPLNGEVGVVKSSKKSKKKKVAKADGMKINEQPLVKHREELKWYDLQVSLGFDLLSQR